MTGCCAARASSPAPRKSGCVASPAAGGAASRPRGRLGSPSGHCSRSSRSPPALATTSTSPGTPSATTSTRGRRWVRRSRQASAPDRPVSGVARVQPQLRNNVKLGGQDGQVWALPDQPMYSFHLVSGRLLTAADQRTQARVLVVEQTIAQTSNTHRGQRVELSTAAGPAQFTVVGIVSDPRTRATTCSRPRTRKPMLL